MKTIGTHLLCELTGCPRASLNNIEFVEQQLRAAAVAAKATVLNGYFHKFSPEGVSGVLCLAESHISIHTWPEAGYAAVDIFTCGDLAMPRLAIDHMIAAFKAEKNFVVEMTRGVHDDGGRYVSVPSSREKVESADVDAPAPVVEAPRVLKRHTPRPLV